MTDDFIGSIKTGISQLSSVNARSHNVSPSFLLKLDKLFCGNAHGQ